MSEPPPAIPSTHTLPYTLPAASTTISPYELIEVIGQGAFGAVYKAMDKTQNTLVAIKHIHNTHELFLDSALIEIQIHQTLEREKEYPTRYDHLVRLIDFYYTVTRELYLVYELCWTDMHSLLYSHASKRGFTQEIVLGITYQVVIGLQWLHRFQLVHRDLKPSNILMTFNGIIKLCDFGSSTNYDSPTRQYSPVRVTLRYRAPELLVGSTSYGPAIDMWALGCVMMELLRGRSWMDLYVYRQQCQRATRASNSGDGIIDDVPVPEPTALEQLQYICDHLGPINQTNWPGFTSIKDNPIECVNASPAVPLQSYFNEYHSISMETIRLIRQLLNYDPYKRPTCQSVLTHPALNSNTIPVAGYEKLALIPSLYSKRRSRQLPSIAAAKPPPPQQQSVQ